jgi:hypothetical protein
MYVSAVDPAASSPSMSWTHAEDVRCLLTRYALEAGVELLAAYGVSLEPANWEVCQARGQFQFIGVVGFSGPQISGSLVLGVTEEPLRRSMPKGTSTRDWSAELANQLLGRVKNKALAWGIELGAQPPAVVSGRHLAPVKWCPDFEPLLLASQRGAVCIWMEMDLDRTVSPDPVLKRQKILREGDVMFF